MPIAPCPTAGRNSSSSNTVAAASARPSRFNPASASSVASAAPSSSLRSRVSTLPRRSTTFRSGRMRRAAPAGAATTCRPSRRAAAGQVARLAADESVAGVLARQECREHKTGRQERRHVLRGMHREIDAAVDQRLLDLLGEQPLAAGLRQRPVLNPVARWCGSPRSRSVPDRGRAPSPAASRTIPACASASGLPRVPIRRIAAWMQLWVSGTGPRNG